MRRIVPIIVLLICFIVLGCNKRITAGEKAAEDYIKSQGYRVITREGEIEKYTLEKSTLYGATKTIPYQQIWGVQKEKPDKYFGKEITTYGFTVKDHPLQKKERYAREGVKVYVMLTEGRVIGGYSYPNAIVDGAFSSIDGKTIEEVTGVSFQQWQEDWKRKYKN